MVPFKININLMEYDTFAEFAKEMELGPRDLALTDQRVYTRIIEPLNLGIQPVFRTKYGKGEPTDIMVDAMLEDFSKMDYDRLIAIGGGAIIDIAKAIAVAEKGEGLDDLYDRVDSLKQVHPLTIIPTTCGTGSEVTKIGVFNRTRLGTKMGLASPALYPENAVLIAELLDTVPYQVYATSSIDAMVHAVESYLSPNRCSASALFSEAALKLVVKSWMKATENGNPEDWKLYKADFLRASNWAGIGFGYGGCAAVHATSYPVGGVYHVPHGQSNQMMFAPVMRKYKEIQPVGRINDLEAVLADCFGCEPEKALEELYALMDKVLVSDPLHEHGVKEEDLPVFAKNVLETQQRLLKNNYIPLTEEQILEIYKDAF